MKASALAAAIVLLFAAPASAARSVHEPSAALLDQLHKLMLEEMRR